MLLRCLEQDGIDIGALDCVSLLQFEQECVALILFNAVGCPVFPCDVENILMQLRDIHRSLTTSPPLAWIIMTYLSFVNRGPVNDVGDSPPSFPIDLLLSLYCVTYREEVVTADSHTKTGLNVENCTRPRLLETKG